MSGHLDGPPPGPPDPPYIPGDLGAPSAEEFARRRASSEPRPEVKCRAPHCWSEYGTPCGDCPSEPRPENPYRTVHARMSPPGAAWDEGFASRQPEIDRLRDRAEFMEAEARRARESRDGWKRAAEDIEAAALAERGAAITAGQKLADRLDSLLALPLPEWAQFAIRSELPAWHAVPGSGERPEGETDGD